MKKRASLGKVRIKASTNSIKEKLENEGWKKTYEFRLGILLKSFEYYVVMLPDLGTHNFK